MATLNTDIQPHPSIARTVSVALEGAIDGSTVVEFQNQLEEQRKGGMQNILLDMSGITYVNSTGVGSLLRFHDTLQTSGGHLVLIGVPSRVKIIFDAFGLDAILTVMVDRASAENHLRSIGAGAEAYESAEETSSAPETFASPPSPAHANETGEAAPMTEAGAPPRTAEYDGGTFVSAPTVKRVTLVRYLARMTTGRNFALVVMISSQEAPAESQANVQQASSSRGGFTVAVDSPVITVVPRIPGCLCVPERLELDVARERTTATFWLTPQVEGDLRHASVDVWKSGYLLDTVPVPAKVRPQAGAGISPEQAAKLTAPTMLWDPAVATSSDGTQMRAIGEYLVAKLAEYLQREISVGQVSGFEATPPAPDGSPQLRIEIRSKVCETPVLSLAGPIHLRASVVEGVVIEANLAVYLDATPLLRPEQPSATGVVPLRFAPTQDGGGHWQSTG